jgi:hypothetical protein
MYTTEYFKVREELEERFWLERPQVLMLDHDTNEIISVLADEREWIERRLREYHSLRHP